jgi:hypothetical protein
MDAERAAWQRLRELRKQISRDATELQVRWHELKRSAVLEWGGIAAAAREFGRLVVPRRRVRTPRAADAARDGAVPGRPPASTLR